MIHGDLVRFLVLNLTTESATFYDLICLGREFGTAPLSSAANVKEKASGHFRRQKANYFGLPQIGECQFSVFTLTETVRQQ